MEAWMYATRIPAVTKYKCPTHPSATLAEFNKPLPASIRWKADNYNHLLEQPTQFYAIALTLAFLGVDVGLAWGYVGLRIIHSLVQTIVNKVMLRFQIFALSGVLLLAMTTRAALLLL